jgi:2-polyprenyl-3-methyl-5-hydroxy-6-metoxy-1,4-benzoquinol methylase
VWYRLMKFEGLLLMPPFAVYYALRKIPFSLRCRSCKSRLWNQWYLRLGLCGSCQRRMTASDSSEYWARQHSITSSRARFVPPYYCTRFVKRLQSGEGRILDVGCGTGVVLATLQSLDYELFGMDMASESINVAKEQVTEAEFNLADAKYIPSKTDTFDCIIATELLEHVSGADAARECYRVLKPGGVALIVVPNGKGPWGRLDPSHVRFFTFQSIRDFLMESGFEIVSGKRIGLYIPLVTAVQSILSQILSKKLPFSASLDIEVPELLANQFFIECRKPRKLGGV